MALKCFLIACYFLVFLPLTLFYLISSLTIGIGAGIWHAIKTFKHLFMLVMLDAIYAFRKIFDI